MGFCACFRKFGLGRMVVGLVLAVILLQVLHISLLSQLENRTLSIKETNQRQQRKLQEQTVAKISSQIHERLKNAHVLDSSGLYHIIPNIITAARFKDSEANPYVNVDDITLVTQSTANHLKDLILLSERWDGPVSVSVFTYDENVAEAIRSIMYFHHCFDGIRERTNFHLVYPLERAPSDLHIFPREINCDQHPEDGHDTDSKDINFAISGIEYPHNILRNLAIKSARTTYVLMVDIDMLPSLNMRSSFLSFIGRQIRSSRNVTMLSKTVYVVPVFECTDKNIPSDKNGLLNFWNMKKIRPFYFEICPRCQKYTGYDKWKSLESLEFLDIAYDIDWQDPWEPFYISRKDIPLYDERFKQYGFNRISQACEMHIAGYQFSVLNNAFLVHRGFKVKGKFHKSKENEQNRNRLLFRTFKEELKTKYSNSNRRCY